MMSIPKRILIIRTDRIGDVVLTTPAIEVVRRNFPNAKITVLLSSATRDLIVGNPFIDEVLIDDRLGIHKGVFGFWRLVNELKRHKFDSAFVFHTKKRTNLLCFWAGIPQRTGYKDKNYGFLLNPGFSDQRHTGAKHESEYCLDLLRRAGLSVEQPALFVPLQPQAEQWAEQWLSHRGVSVNEKIVAVHPGASDATKCWPASSFAQLIDALIDEDYRVIVIGQGMIIQMALQDISAQTKAEFINLTAQTSVAQMASLLKRCRLLISNDSGPVHIAAALGIYVISLFLRHQPGINPERWRPLGERGFILSNKLDEAVEINSAGQIESGSRDSIPVNEVLSLARKLLQKS